MTISPKRALTVSYIAEHLDVQERTVRAWIESSDLRAVNIAVGKKRPTYRVAVGALETFLVKRGWTLDDVREALALQS